MGVKKEILKPSADISDIEGSDIIFVAIGLDFIATNNGYDNLQSLCTSLSAYIKRDTLLVMESTLPPGTIDRYVIPSILEANPSISQKDLNLVYAYERVMPGPEYMSSLKNLPKVFGALNEKSRKLYEEHLHISIPGLDHRCLPNIVSAELSKVVENSYRMVNIALVAEFSDFAFNIGADLVGILEAIRMRPTHSNIRFAGQAPGGYCLTKDPEFLFETSRVQGLNMDLNIISSAVEKTKQMNNIIHDYANSMLDQSKTCTFLGISYRSGVGDLRESSALELALNLNKQNYKLEIVDPFVDPNEVRNFFDITDSDKTSKIQAVLAVKHAKFDLKYLSQFQLIIDINSCLSVKERSVLRNKGVKIKQFGDFS
jgi:nucleotide sugar dehydrogenase